MSAIINTLRAALEAVPDSWEARLALVEAFLTEGQSEEAGQVLAEVNELPLDLDERVQAGRAWGLLDPEDGLSIISGILDEDPTHARAHFEKAKICIRTGDSETAQRHYFTALTFDPLLEDTMFASDLVGQSVPGSSPESQPLDSGPTKNRENLFYPKPGEYPVRTLREALGMPPIRPLVDPGTIPGLPDLSYETERTHRESVHTPEETFRQQLQNVHLVPKAEEEMVYDYQQPDDSVFEANRSPDQIYVAALVTESGEQVATLQETILRNEKDQSIRLESERNRDGFASLGLAVGVVAGICILLSLVAVLQPKPPPPLIAATALPEAEEELERHQIQRPELQKRPETSAAPSLDVITAATNSPMSLPDMDISGVGMGYQGVHTGLGFGQSMNFGTPGGMSFLGSKTRGDLAVVFDITNSMYDATPVVIKEIQKVYRNAQVVCVFGGGFEEEKFDGLIPFKENAKVQGIVDQYAKGKITADLKKALYSLKRCDSLKVDHKGDFRQSVGAGIEALLRQPMSPGTIFVFSDFEDGLDPDYMAEIKRLVQRKGAKIVFWYPFAKGSSKWKSVKKHYEGFAKSTKGELKEEELK